MNLYENHGEFIKALRELWNYMRLNQKVEKADLIIGCGCANLEIPVKCAQLFKAGYASKILFCGGLGKITKDKFDKSEAEIFSDIAIKEGINEGDILIETKSTNTGDNFRFALDVLSENNIVADLIIVVCGFLSERRNFASARAILKEKKIMVTSPDLSFEEFLEQLKKDEEWAKERISVVVGDIQRMIIFPQFGWQIEDEVPVSVINSYNYLKKLGFTKYIYSREEIDNLINKYGIIEGYSKNYFN